MPSFILHMDKKLVHTMRLPIRWGDMDAMGHVNNTVYFRYMEQARIDWLSDVGFAVEPSSEGPVIVQASCTFMRQLKYPGEIEIQTFTGAPGRSSFETTQEIRRIDQPEVLCATGTAKVVWVNFKLEKSIPMPDSLRYLLTKEER